MTTKQQLLIKIIEAELGNILYNDHLIFEADEDDEAKAMARDVANKQKEAGLEGSLPADPVPSMETDLSDDLQAIKSFIEDFQSMGKSAAFAKAMKGAPNQVRSVLKSLLPILM